MFDVVSETRVDITKYEVKDQDMQKEILRDGVINVHYTSTDTKGLCSRYFRCTCCRVGVGCNWFVGRLW